MDLRNKSVRAWGQGVVATSGENMEKKECGYRKERRLEKKNNNHVSKWNGYVRRRKRRGANS